MMGIPAQLQFACHWQKSRFMAVRGEEVESLISFLLYSAHRQLPLLFLVLKGICNRRNCPDGYSTGPENRTWSLKEKGHFSANVCLSAAEV